jgi:hypothetical protein
MHKIQSWRGLRSSGLIVNVPAQPVSCVRRSRRPTETITWELAIIAYTLTTAEAEFAEKNKGSLEPNELADLAVLSGDIFTLVANAIDGGPGLRCEGPA